MAQLELHDLTVFYPGQETPRVERGDSFPGGGRVCDLVRPVGQRKVYPSALLQACPGAPGDPAGGDFLGGEAPVGAVGPSPERQHRICGAVSREPDGHGPGLAGAGLWPGESGLGPGGDPPPCGGDGLLLWHPDLVSPGDIHPLRGTETAAGPGGGDGAGASLAAAG